VQGRALHLPPARAVVFLAMVARMITVRIPSPVNAGLNTLPSIGVSRPEIVPVTAIS
jgi:hypothetical protein